MAALALAGGAIAQYEGGYGGSGAEPAAEVDANGNPFTGGLGFDPVEVSVGVGEVVRWTNTDELAPHTVTEESGLWELSGEYGPPGTMGFGPGDSVRRAFEAASFDYFCAIHGADTMSGRVEVPVRVRRRGDRLRVRWASSAPEEGQSFDVQGRVQGQWRFVERDTTEKAGRFPGRLAPFRARLGTDQAHSGWSPPAAA